MADAQNIELSSFGFLSPVAIDEGIIGRFGPRGQVCSKTVAQDAPGIAPTGRVDV
jgi:hypothetical protein